MKLTLGKNIIFGKLKGFWHNFAAEEKSIQAEKIVKLETQALRLPPYVL